MPKKVSAKTAKVKTQKKNELEMRSLKGMTVCLAGVFQSMDVDDFEAWVKARGAKVSKLVEEAQVLVAGRSKSGGVTRAEQKARKLVEAGEELQIVSETEFFAWFTPSLETKRSWLTGGAKGLEKWNEFRQNPDLRVPVIPLAGVDLSNLELTNCDLSHCDLTGANLSQTNHTKADLFHAVLRDANMSQAKFCDAILAGADLSGAKLDKADFTGAGCSGTKFDKKQLAEHQELQQAVMPYQGQVRTGLKAIDRTAKQAERLETTVQVQLPRDAHATLEVVMSDKKTCAYYSVQAGNERMSIQANTFSEAMLHLAQRWAHGTARLDTVTCEGRRVGLDPLKRQRLAMEAWVEAFGLDEASPPTGGSVDFASLVQRLALITDMSRFSKARKMLQSERFRLFAEVTATHLVGVVRSQRDPNIFYSCVLKADGNFGCCSHDLVDCMGLNGKPCKHLLVLIIGLAKAGEFDLPTIDAWIQASTQKRPKLDQDLMADTLLRYKGAQAGEIDWRPTETIPEDFYSL